MRCAVAFVGILAGFCALSGAETEAAGPSLFDKVFSGRSDASPLEASILARPTPSLRNLNRAYSPVRAYSPWLQANEPTASAALSNVRTVCVRMCDGYYWPVSEVADQTQVAQDAAACASSCRSEARLFTLPRGSEDIAAMTDLRGRAYGQLENAFAYRKSLKSGCGCQASPWSGETQARHASYAAAEALRKSRLAGLTSPPPALETLLAEIENEPSRPGRLVETAIEPEPHGIAMAPAIEPVAMQTETRVALTSATMSPPPVASAFPNDEQAVPPVMAKTRARRAQGPLRAQRRVAAPKPAGRGLFAW